MRWVVSLLTRIRWGVWCDSQMSPRGSQNAISIGNRWRSLRTASPRDVIRNGVVMKLSIIPRRCSTLFPFSICRVEIKMMNNCPLCLPAYVRYFRVISSQQGDENLTYLKFVALRSRCGLKCTKSLKFVSSNSFIRALFLQESSLLLKSLVWSIRRRRMTRTSTMLYERQATPTRRSRKLQINDL